MRSNFDACTMLVLRTEGGYTNDPRDPGGPTYMGITLATARACIDPTMTAARLKALPLDHIESVYRTMYADRVHFDALPSGLDYALYDYAVNSGTGRANRVIRQLVGAPAGTSMTTEVLTAVAAREPAALIRAVSVERLAFMRSLRASRTFGKGWAVRVAAVEAQALALAAEPAVGVTSEVGKALDAAQAVPAKATVRRLPGHVVADGAAGKTTIAAGVAGAIVAGASASTGFHLGGYAALVLAILAFCAVGALVFLVDRVGAKAAVKPAPGTTPIAAITLSPAAIPAATKQENAHA